MDTNSVSPPLKKQKSWKLNFVSPLFYYIIWFLSRLLSFCCSFKELHSNIFNKSGNSKTFSIAPFLACLLLHVFYNVWKLCLSICEHIVLLWFLKYHVLSILFQFCFQGNKYDDYWNQVHTFVEFIYMRETGRYFFLINQTFWCLGHGGHKFNVNVMKKILKHHWIYDAYSK